MSSSGVFALVPADKTLTMSVRHIFIRDPEPCSESAGLTRDDESNHNRIDDFLTAGKTLYKTKILEGEIYELMRASARAMMPHIHPWAFNRPLDSNHVDAIYDALRTTRYPFLLGTFKFVHVVPEGRVYMIDGQHRHTALARALSDDASFDMKIILELYHIKSTNDVAIQHLFDKANNSLSLARESTPSRFLINVINAMCTDPELNPMGKPNIVDVPPCDTKRRVNRPRIAKKVIANIFQTSPALADLILMEPNDLVERVRQVNAWLSTLPITALFDCDNDATRRRRASGKTIGFFLNLGGKWPPERWVQLLTQDPTTWKAHNDST